MVGAAGSVLVYLESTVLKSESKQMGFFPVGGAEGEGKRRRIARVYK